MAAPATPANRLPATLTTARAMSTVGIELDLISPFVPRPNTYGYDLEALYASPYQSPRWVTYWRGAWDNLCRRLETKSKNQLMCDVMALFTGIPQERQLIHTRGGMHRLPDFMVESDLSAYHAEELPALKHTDTAQAVSRWRESEESESNLLAALGLERYSPLPRPEDPNTRGTRPVSPFGMTIRPLLDEILCPALAIVVTNSAIRNGFITEEPQFGPVFKRARRSEVGARTSASVLAGPSSAPSMATVMPSVLAAYPTAVPQESVQTAVHSRKTSQRATAKRRRPLQETSIHASIAYVHASEIEGQVDEAVAERALSSAILQVLAAFEACGTFIATASCHTCWLRILALKKNHVILETVDPEEAFQTVTFADMLRVGKIIERFAWDLRDLGTLHAPEPDMETIEQVWLAMYAAFRIAAEWPLEGPIPRVRSYGQRQQRWMHMAEIAQTEPSNGTSQPENGLDQSIRARVAEALGVDISPAGSPSPSLPATFIPRRESDNEAVLAGESAMGFREWARFFHSHPDLVAFVARLDITVTFVTPSYLDSLIVERIPGYRSRQGQLSALSGRTA
ncbi:hypothetical protein NliqN6_2165 [Naganishia liquefaciens]|uniref:Uncharacterized protein n=1 Tax=Naganishia liquefaciens TaxID=104408 RepID=A0A8H3YE05_9TREE|nr:hypothetical protein NliqN6_2165 [Naganishia liquefaciens]